MATKKPTAEPVFPVDANAGLQKDNSGPERGKHVTEGTVNLPGLKESLIEATRQATLPEKQPAVTHA